MSRGWSDSSPTSTATLAKTTEPCLRSAWAAGNRLRSTYSPVPGAEQMNRRMFAIMLLAAPLMTGCGYNKIQSLTQEVDASQGMIQAQLQRRADLIPNLVNTVKGYATHEEETFTKVAEARAGLQSAIKSGDATAMANA